MNSIAAIEKPDVSIVVPTFNEEESILQLISEVRGALAGVQWSWEMVLVDDGSTDATADLLRSAARDDARLRPIFQWINRGQSAAFHRGFLEARGALMVTMDGDLQNDPADIPALVEKADLRTAVCGIRVKRRDTLARRISSRVANWIRSNTLQDGVTDTGCSLKVMPRAHSLSIPHFRGAHRFYPALLQQAGVAIVQLPVGHRPRLHGESKYSHQNRAFTGFVDLLGVAWLKRRSFSIPDAPRAAREERMGDGLRVRLESSPLPERWQHSQST